MLHNTKYKRKLSPVRDKCFTFSIVPLGSIFALLFLGFGVVNAECCFATDEPTASLTLSNNNLTTSIGNTNDIATVSTNVTVEVDNAESYSLTLSFNNVALSNGDTIISAVGEDGTLADDTWGYRWNEESTYSAPTTANTELSVPDLDDHSANFEKTLTFAAKFSKEAEAGHYVTTGTLSLTATPRQVAGAEWKDADGNGTEIFSGITTMQEIWDIPDFCTNSEVKVGYTIELIDNRPEGYPDGRDSTYTIRKMEDGKCWMTQNLRLVGASLTSGDSNVSSSFTLVNTDPGAAKPSSWTSKSNNANYAWYYAETDTTYYTYYTATAGTAPSAAGETNYSICPKGWKLPSGGRNYDSNFSDFYNLIVVGIFNNNSTYIDNLKADHLFSDSSASSTLRNSTYNFADTGYVINGSLNYATTSDGSWWSRTADSGTNAYYLYINSSYVGPGTIYAGDRYFGYAVRCVAEEKPGVWVKPAGEGESIDTGLEYMQDIEENFCNKDNSILPVGSTIRLKDNRSPSPNGNTYNTNGASNMYTIRKMEDGRCWMIENLRITGSSDGTLSLSSTDSNVSSYTLPKNNVSAFPYDDGIAEASYYDSTFNTGYYTWYTATAAADSSNDNTDAGSDICPKNWQMPTGGTRTTSDFYKLVNSINAKKQIFSGALSSSYDRYNSWANDGLKTFQDNPYNFAYTGFVYYGDLYESDEAYWWSRTTYDDDSAYELHITSSHVYPGTHSNARCSGSAVRCVAQY